jgi:hypothetical protein
LLIAESISFDQIPSSFSGRIGHFSFRHATFLPNSAFPLAQALLPDRLSQSTQQNGRQEVVAMRVHLVLRLRKGGCIVEHVHAKLPARATCYIKLIKSIITANKQQQTTKNQPTNKQTTKTNDRQTNKQTNNKQTTNKQTK